MIDCAEGQNTLLGMTDATTGSEKLHLPHLMSYRYYRLDPAEHGIVHHLPGLPCKMQFDAESIDPTGC